MSDKAVIAPIKTFPHPNADRLQLGNVMGFQVVTGLDVEDGDLGVYFNDGLQLSEEYAASNDLVRIKNEDGSYSGGMFDTNRRVRCQKFRQQKSEGYWAPLTSLSFTGNIDKLQMGDQISELHGTPICNKYITKATRQQGIGGKNKKKRGRGATPQFPKHFDTDQLRFHLHQIQPSDRLIVSLKMHGTSARTGYCLEDRQLKWWEKILIRLGVRVETREYTYLNGTRNVIKDGEPYRQESAALFHNCLHPGEIVYYEIVGYSHPGSPIMGSVSTDKIQDKKLKKEIEKHYGNFITYKYGCPDGTHAVYVYRIVNITPNGVAYDLPWEQVKDRCQELGVPHVQEMATVSLDDYDGDTQAMLDDFDNLIDKPDPIDPSHPTEGVCVRIDGKQPRVFKHKSFTFGLLEGYIKEDVNYVDTEESS
jgi:hypothetical protein